MKRLLKPDELIEAKLVFGDGMDYSRVYVTENARLPNLAADLGAAMQGKKRTWHNAITLGNNCLFPFVLDTPRDAGQMAWLMHELTHQWQFQQLGWVYLARAIWVQTRYGMKCYDYTLGTPSKEEGLFEAKKRGLTLWDFNLEQQGDIARDYYIRLKRGEDASGWEPFIGHLREKQSTMQRK